MKVKFIYSNSSEDFEREINEALSKGWTLHGNHCFQMEQPKMFEVPTFAYTQMMIQN